MIMTFVWLYLIIASLFYSIYIIRTIKFLIKDSTLKDRYYLWTVFYLLILFLCSSLIWPYILYVFALLYIHVNKKNKDEENG